MGRIWQASLAAMGKVLKSEGTGSVFKIEALYHINGGAFHFTAHNFITETDVITDKGVKGQLRDPRSRHGRPDEGRTRARRIPDDQPVPHYQRAGWRRRRLLLSGHARVTLRQALQTNPVRPWLSGVSVRDFRGNCFIERPRTIIQRDHRNS
jgi:hypothetical protein